MRSLLLKPFLYTATIEGRKTETRRLHGLKEINKAPNDWQLSKVEIIVDRLYAVFTHNNRSISTVRMICAKFRINEELYLAESHFLPKKDANIKGLPVIYNDTLIPAGSENILGYAYRPISPMFLKQEHAREFVRIKGISIERAHDITEEAAKREGIDLSYSNNDGLQYRAAYIAAWDEINKTMPFAMNPWLFVYYYDYLKEKSKRK